MRKPSHIGQAKRGSITLDSLAFAGEARAALAPRPPMLADLQRPVGAIIGTGEGVVRPGTLDTIRALCPDAACEAVTDAGHISMIERPRQFVTALERVLVAIS